MTLREMFPYESLEHYRKCIQNIRFNKDKEFIYEDDIIKGDWKNQWSFIMHNMDDTCYPGRIGELSVLVNLNGRKPVTTNCGDCHILLPIDNRLIKLEVKTSRLIYRTSRNKFRIVINDVDERKFDYIFLIIYDKVNFNKPYISVIPQNEFIGRGNKYGGKHDAHWTPPANLKNKVSSKFKVDTVGYVIEQFYIKEFVDLWTGHIKLEDLNLSEIFNKIDDEMLE